MLPNTIQRVTKNHGFPEIRIKEWLHAQMVARAEQPLTRPVPDGEDEISKQVLDTVFAPGLVGSKQQLSVGRSVLDIFTACREVHDQVRLGVHPRIRKDPYKTVECERLTHRLNVVGSAKQCVAEANLPLNPNFLCIRTAKC